MVSCGENARHDYGVDDTSGGVGSSHLENEGKGGGASFLGVKVWVVVRDVEADQKDREEAIES